MSAQPQLPTRPPRPSISFALRILFAGLLVAVIGATVVAFSIHHEADEIVSELKKSSQLDPGTVGVLDDVQSGKPQTMLLVGDDHRYAEGGAGGQRSDTMILVRLDPDAKATTMLSLPRDLQITQAGGGSAKLNAAYAGGPKPLIETLKRILSTPGEPFRINHFVSIRFTAFSKAVNTFGCFYADIDRKYFNDNNPPAGGGNDPYATIDVPAGYQRLCGEASLDYVRFRHLDSDLVREARQTHYLAEARAQIADSTLLTKRQELLKAISRYIKTDIQSERGLLGVVKLAVNVVQKPTKRVELKVHDAPDGNVETSPGDLAQAAKDFLHPRVPAKSTGKASKSKSSSGRKAGKQKKRKAPKVPATLFSAPAPGRDAIASNVAPNIDGLPIYYPKLLERQSRYQPMMSTGYDIASPGGTTFPWQAYRLVVLLGRGSAGPGQYYGVQGTTWKDPPILKLATGEETLGGRKFLVEYDGSKIRRLSWKAPNATYWISNTLNNRLTNNEMRALARSLTRYGTS